MSRNTPRARARIDELADELTFGAARHLRRDADEIREVVQAVVDYLLQEYPAQDLYIPSAVAWPVEEIRAAMAAGKSIRWICKEFRVGRQTVYRLTDAANDD